MKKILISILVGIMVIMLGACGKTKDLTAAELISQFKDANLKISDAVVFDEKTDKNNMLGKPNQYISKVNFADARLEQGRDSDPNGGSIETFNNKKDLKARKEYLESVYKQLPGLKEYLFVNGKYLLRLSNGLTGAQMEEYKKVFMKLR